MAIPITADPILTAQEVKDILGINEDAAVVVMINSVSEKFRKFTNRVRITEGSVSEMVRSYDGQIIWAHASPINITSDVTIKVFNTDQTIRKTYSMDAHDIVVDATKGRIARPDCGLFEELCGCGVVDKSFSFPSLQLEYTGGWDVVPGDIMMAAFEQIKMENERLKGTIGLQTDDAASLQIDGLLKSVSDVWKKHRIMI